VSASNDLFSLVSGHLHANGHYGGNTDTFLDYTIAAVPEPSSWALLIAGFGLTGLMARRRRPRSVAA
jgi:hypothetical protein